MRIAYRGDRGDECGVHVYMSDTAIESDVHARRCLVTWSPVWGQTCAAHAAAQPNHRHARFFSGGLSPRSSSVCDGETSLPVPSS